MPDSATRYPSADVVLPPGAATLSGPALPSLSDPVPRPVGRPAAAYPVGAVRGVFKVFVGAGWLLGFLMQLYALYALSLGMVATQRVIRWRAYRLWAARVECALRELEVRGIEQLGS